jgi:tetratricopeptide (TPR) repeat protein
VKKITTLFIVLILAYTTIQAKQITPEKISESYFKAYNYEKAGNYTDAIKALQLVYQDYPDAYGINNRLASLFLLQGYYRNAIEHYEKAIKALPNAISPKSGLMYVYILTKNYEEANKLGYQIINVDFYNYYANLRLAHVLRKSDKLDLADKVLVKMLIRYPSDILYLSEFGLLKYQQKEMERSKAIMLDVLILDPENFSAKSILQELDDQ